MSLVGFAFGRGGGREEVHYNGEGGIGKWNSYRISDDESVGFRGVLGHTFGKVPDNGGVGVEKIYHIVRPQFNLSESYTKFPIPSLVIPGFLGTPAGISTISAPLNASFKPLFSGEYPLTMLLVLMCPTSAATPSFN